MYMAIMTVSGICSLVCYAGVDEHTAYGGLVVLLLCEIRCPIQISRRLNFLRTKAKRSGSVKSKSISLKEV